jgi:hypothetical protein
MSEHEAQSTAALDTDALLAAAHHPDYLLQDLVAIANLGVQIGLTLTVGGSTISGMLIGGKEFMQRLTESITEVAPDELVEPLQERFQPYRDIYEQSELKPATFVHLADARVVATGGEFPVNGCLWRGRISQVSGFSIGVMSSVWCAPAARHDRASAGFFLPVARGLRATVPQAVAVPWTATPVRPRADQCRHWAGSDCVTRDET